MPDPDDDVELPPSYDFTGGFGTFLPAPPSGDPGDPVGPGDPADPAGSAGPPASAAPASTVSTTSADPVMQPGGRPVLPGGSPPVPPTPPTRTRGSRPTGPPVYGTAPTTSPASPGSAPAPPRPPRQPRTKHRKRTRGSTPVSPPSTTSTSPPGAGRSGWTPGRMAGTAAAVVTAAVVIGVNVGGDGAGGGGPRVTTVPVEPDTSSIAWSVEVDRESRLMQTDLAGSYDLVTGLGSAVVVGDALVGRFAADRFDADGPATVRAIDLADGTGRDLLALERARCAAVPGAFGRGSDLVTCSGVDEGDPVLTTLNVVTGEEVGRWAVPAPVELLTVTPAGVATLDAVEPDVGATALRWYSPTGTPLWSVPSADLPESARTELLQERDEGFELLYNATLVPVGDGALLTGSQAAVLMDASGVTSTTFCWAGAVVGDVVACENESTRAAEGRTASGELLWSDEDLSLGLSFSRRAPVTMAGEYVSLEDGYRMDNSLVDPRTGRTGSVLPEIEGSPRVSGTVGAPVAIVEERREDYDEATVATVTLLDPVSLGIRWSVDLPARQYASLVVTQDRVLVEVDRRRWTVLDLADGSVVGGMATEGDVVAVVEGGVVTADFAEMARIELP